MERNSNATLPNDEESVVALPQEREDNSSECNHGSEAELNQPSEPDQSRDDVASPASHREEEVIPIRPQRDKRPPAWLEDFITGGELEESLAVQPETLAAHSVKVSKQTPLPAVEETPIGLVEMELHRQLIGLEEDILWCTGRFMSILSFLSLATRPHICLCLLLSMIVSSKEGIMRQISVFLSCM